MAEDLTERIARTMGRRRFLKNVAAGALGVVMWWLGNPSPAVGLFDYGCCTLCKSPSPTCSGCSCEWCWVCIVQPGGGYYHCCECYSAGHSCNGSCNGVICSHAWFEPCCQPSGQTLSAPAS